MKGDPCCLFGRMSKPSTSCGEPGPAHYLRVLMRCLTENGCVSRLDPTDRFFMGASTEAEEDFYQMSTVFHLDVSFCCESG